MRTFGIKNLTVLAGLVFAMVIVSATETSAQTRREIEQERQRIEREQRNYERQNRRLERQRNRQRQARGYVNDGANDRRLSRASVNATLFQGYQQGLMAGESDRRARKYNRLNVYRNTGSAPNAGDPTSTDYLYRQGYLEGYEDGFHGRIRYQ